MPAMTSWQTQTIQQFHDLYFERVGSLTQPNENTGLKEGMDTFLAVALNITSGVLSFIPLADRRATLEAFCTHTLRKAEEAGGQLGGLEILTQQIRSPQ